MDPRPARHLPPPRPGAPRRAPRPGLGQRARQRRRRGRLSRPSACVVGLGRVGLPTAALAAVHGDRVVGVDRAAAVREAVRQGRVGAAEPGLEALVARALHLGLTVAEAAVPADVTVLCVPTPLGPHGADLADLDDAVSAVVRVAPPDGLVLVASTVPVGTTERVAAQLPGRAVAYCPERVLPGDALREMTENPRVVGGVDPAAGERAAAWLRGWVRGPVERTDARTAELAKLVENAARDVEVALANTVAGLAEALGVDAARLHRIVGQHPRVRLLAPGIGVGGHCLPVDPWFAIGAAPAQTALLRTAREVNEAVTTSWAERIAAAARRAGARRIGLLGLAYKPDTDDLRHAPALRIARALQAEFDVVAADPWVTGAEVEGIPVRSVDEVVACDVVALLVAHTALLGVQVPADRVRIDACGGWR
ncbi:MAG: nucleotide sugar dehydrogenase [Myxococcota bacterium]